MRGPVVARPGTLDEFLEQYDLVKPRFRVISFSVCAGIGLTLSMIGLFGVMAYSVALQTHDLGVRMALGAQEGNILRLVLRQGVVARGRRSVAGTRGGDLVRALAGVAAVGECRRFDSGTFTLASLALLATGLLACYVPRAAGDAGRSDDCAAV